MRGPSDSDEAKLGRLRRDPPAAGHDPGWTEAKAEALRAAFAAFVLDQAATLGMPEEEVWGLSSPSAAWTEAKVEALRAAFAAFVLDQAATLGVPEDQVWTLLEGEALDPEVGP
jgi:hypothetical protein